MKFDEINQALEDIIDLRNQIYALDKSNADFPAKSQALETLEKQLLAKYGTQLHEVLLDVHDELCPDNDVEEPTNYIAPHYQVNMNGAGKKYQVNSTDGVLVQMDDYPHEPTRLVLAPNPFRVILNINANQAEEVWSSTNNQVAY